MAMNLQAFVQYLRQLPPAAYGDPSKTELCQWSQTFIQHTLPHTSFNTACKNLLETFQAYSVQDIIVSDQLCEAWARSWCDFLNIAIAGETSELSQQRLMYVSPANLQQHKQAYERYQKREQALNKMRNRIPQNNT